MMYIAMMFQLSYQFNCLCDWTVWGSLWILSDVYSNDVSDYLTSSIASVIGQSGGPSGYYLMYIAMMYSIIFPSSIASVIGQSGGPSGYYLMYIAMMFQLSYQFKSLCDWTVRGSLWIPSDVYSNAVSIILPVQLPL